LTVAPTTGSPGADLDGHGLAGQKGGVHGGAAVGDDPVGGDLLPGADHEDVTDREPVDRDPDLVRVAQHGDVLGSEVHQRAQRRSGPLLGPRLEVAAGEDEHGHHRGHLEVDVARPAIAGGQ